MCVSRPRTSSAHLAPALAVFAGLLVLVVGGIAWSLRDDEPGNEPLQPAALEDEEAPSAPSLVAAHAPAGDASTAASERVSASTSEPASDVVAAPAIDTTMPAGPWHCVVLDERANARLPRFAVEIADAAGRRLVAVTDADGALTSEPVAFGRLFVVALDHPARRSHPAPLEVQHAEGGGPPFTLRVQSGPTYRVRVVEGKPVPLEGALLTASLANVANETAELADEPLRAAAPYVEPGESPWVRFAAPRPFLTRIDRVVARAGDGLWRAEARNASVLVGVATEPLVLEFRERAALSGVVRDENGPVARAVVVVQSRDRRSRGGQPPATRTDSDGRYRIADLPPGKVDARAAGLGQKGASQTLELLPATEVTHEFVLTALPTAGAVRGVVRSDTGRYAGDVAIVLTRTDGDAARAPLRRSVVFGAGGPNQPDGTFDFGEVPAGKYRIELREQDFFAWERPPQDLVVPCEPLAFRVHDSVPVADLVLDVADAGRPLADFHLHLWTSDGERQLRASSGQVVLAGYPEDKKLTWRLDAAGFPPIVGDLESFASRSVAEGRMRRTFSRALEPGFGDVVRVTSRKDKKAVAGALVSVDGTEVGKTDGSGRVAFVTREAPRQISVRHDKYRPTSVEWKPAEARGFEREIGVVLAPNGKK